MRDDEAKMVSVKEGEGHPLAGLDLQTLIDGMEDEVVVLDSDGVIVTVNRAWCAFSSANSGDTAHYYLGHNYLGICRSAEGPSSAGAGIIPEGLQRTLRSGAPFRTEYPCDSPDEKRWFELTASRFSHLGRDFLLVQHRNITARHVDQEEIEQAFINSSAMIAMVATTSDAILSYDLEGRIITWNKAAERLYGYTQEEALGQSLEILYPPDWPKRISEYRDEILAGRLEQFEATRIAKDGTPHEVWISGAPIRSLNGDVVAISNIHRDVTEIRKMERARDLMAHEVIHRAKNMLTIVTAILRQTARAETTLEGFLRNFEARIQSLARSTDLLVNNVWTSVDIGKVIERHLHPFVQAGDTRLEIVGPKVELKPQAVQTLGLALHELATNSAKYGALSAKGRVSLNWTPDSVGQGQVLRLAWTETGIEVDVSGTRSGFGSTVLTRLAPSMLDAETEYERAADQVRWAISIPPQHFLLPN